MMVSSNSTVACSPCIELRNEFDWYEHSLLPQTNNIRQELSGVGSRKYDFITGAHSSFNVLQSAQEVNGSLSNADTSILVIGSECWKNEGTIMDVSVASQTVFEGDKASAPVFYSRESGDIELSTWNISRNLRCIKYEASSEIKKHFTFYQTVEQKFGRSSRTRSGSVEIKVEVDPNLYETCETPVDEKWSGFHLKNTQCNRPTVTLLSKSNSLVNNEQNIYVHNSDGKDFDITNNKYHVGNGQGQVADTGNSKRLVESELDNKQNHMGCEESGIEARTPNEDGSEICTETPRVEESGDSYDLKSSCNSEEHLDMKLSGFYKFQCDKCSERQTFSNFRILTQHCREKHQTKSFVSCCDQTLWERDELLDHMLNHKDSYRCAECQQVFTDTSMWKDHLQQHLQTADLDPFHCPRCNKQFSSKYGLANHVNLHLPETERPHKCQYCNKGFGAKHAMTKHERTHLPDEERLSYVCDICGKRFGYASTLDGHQRHVHQNERPFVCHVCAKSFPIKGALTYHLTTHEVQDRVQCTQCGIWLKNEKILRIHKKCHQGELFACPHCDKLSSTRNNLRMHMKRHSDARPHTCPLCAHGFKTPRDLKTHMVQHTGQKPYSCPYCPKTFASPSNFYAHRKMKHEIPAASYE